jgi:DNA-binding transcriptional ArsR family regulator
MKALASEMRLRILDVLRERESCTVGRLAKVIGADCSTASQHMAILRRAGLVRSEKRAAWVVCEVTPAGRRVLDCCEHMVECMARRELRFGSQATLR